MFARITSYRLKPDTIDTAMEIMKNLKPQIMAMRGMKQFINAVDDDGNGYIVAIIESEEASESNHEKVKELWQQFADVLAEPPTPGGFRIMANESNA